jgi:anti-sigma factor RsiW
MNHYSEEPTPERLAAFADGELGERERAHVAAWLATHPEAAAELESLGRLADACRATAPPEPTPSAWAAALSRIEAALPTLASPRRRQRRLPLRPVAGLAAAAAAVLVVLLGRPPAPVPPMAVPAPDEPFPVASSDDVTIVRMGGADARALVVGQPPVTGPLDWATHDDITVVQVERFEGQAPDMHVDGVAPMLVASSPPDERAP